MDSGEESDEEDVRKRPSCNVTRGPSDEDGETGDGECLENSRCNDGFFSRLARMEADRASAEIEEEKETEGVDLRCVSGFRATLSRGPGN